MSIPHIDPADPAVLSSGEVIPSVSDQAEPSAQHIAQLAGVIQQEDVRAIIVGGTAGRGLHSLVND